MALQRPLDKMPKKLCLILLVTSSNTATPKQVITQLLRLSVSYFKMLNESQAITIFIRLFVFIIFNKN